MLRGVCVWKYADGVLSVCVFREGLSSVDLYSWNRNSAAVFRKCQTAYLCVCVRACVCLMYDRDRLKGGREVYWREKQAEWFPLGCMEHFPFWGCGEKDTRLWVSHPQSGHTHMHTQTQSLLCVSAFHLTHSPHSHLLRVHIHSFFFHLWLLLSTFFHNLCFVFFFSFTVWLK